MSANVCVTALLPPENNLIAKQQCRMLLALALDEAVLVLAAMSEAAAAFRGIVKDLRGPDDLEGSRAVRGSAKSSCKASEDDSSWSIRVEAAVGI
jgi:hypothetical protein